MLRFICVALCMMLTITITACDSEDKIDKNSMANLSTIEIQANYNKITPTVISTSTKESDYWDMSSFQSIMENPDRVVPYVKIGETISIKFHGQKSVPDSYELLDYVLTDKGTVKYNKSDLSKIAIEFNNKTASFVLPENILTYASSKIEDYGPGAVLRGLRIVLKWEHTTQEIVFIITTDAIQKEA